ncbi:MAG: imidazolonepropionase [Fimbriimonadaceae bacterium]|nr:imidazolonepropionase [Fimbriimonadaceae bacterium]
METPLTRTALLGGTLATLSGPARARTGPELGEVEVIPDGGVLFREGRIAAVGSRDQIEALLEPADATVELEGRLVTPGFVDAHTHAVFAGNRAHEFEALCTGSTYAEIAAKGGGIRSTMRAVRNASEEELIRQSARHVRWMMASGTTCAEIKSGYGLDLECEFKMLRVAGRLAEHTGLRLRRTFLGAHAVPPEFEGRRTAYLDHVLEEMLPAVRTQGLAEAADMFVEEGYFDARDAERLAEACRHHGMSLRLHVDQLRDGGGAALAARLGARTADHLEHTGDSGIRALAAAHVFPVLLPASVFGLRLDRYPNARAMADAGLPIVLATDFNPGSAPSPSMPFSMGLACRFMGLTAREALVAATINPAHALGLSKEVGSLDPGKRADAVVWDLDAVEEIPYYLGAPALHSVWVQGRSAPV